MKKPAQSTKSKQSLQSFTDFTSKLSAKWRLLTTPVKPPQPQKVASDIGGKGEMEAILRQLIGIPTVTGNYAANHDALDYIERFLQKRGMFVGRVESKGLETLVATTRKTKTPKVALTAHLDVVPADHSLFELREADGSYYGRGVLDMKFAIAAFMQCVDDLGGELARCDFGIFITTDEEVGGDSVENLLQEGYVPKVCVMPDGGDNWQIQTYSKGFLSLIVSAEGQAAHGSRPWQGENAVLAVMGALTELQSLFPDMSADTNSINVGRIQGGQAVNQIAADAEALVDVRYTTEPEGARLLQQMEQICQKHGTSLQVAYRGATTNFDLKNPLIAPFAELITEVTGTKVIGSRTLGSNDTRYYAARGIPCISVYPTGGGHHGPNEWLDKQSFFQFHTILLRYLEQIARR